MYHSYCFLYLLVSNQSFFFNLSDGSVRDGLYHEFKKHGDVSRIFVNGQGSSRYAIVHFRRYILVSPFLLLDPPKYHVLRTSASFYKQTHCCIWIKDLKCTCKWLRKKISSQIYQWGTLTTKLHRFMWQLSCILLDTCECIWTHFNPILWHSFFSSHRVTWKLLIVFLKASLLY